MDKELLHLIKNFENVGENFVVGKRNKIKTIPYKNLVLNVKSFKIPSLIQGFVYRFLRASKAKRSYNYAKILEEKGIGTPKPIAYYENKTSFKLLDSYYISEHLIPDLVFKDLFDRNFTDEEIILQQFAHFSFKLHEAGIEFLDHSPGNTLIKKTDTNKYSYYLVDLNRMKFHKNMDFNTRMKNLSRITPSKEMVKVISYEYAKLYNKEEKVVFDLMWNYTSNFQKRFLRKKRIKKALMFWKN
jgi:hypothetical protein